MIEQATVFISHSSADNPFTEQLVADLKAAGIAVWVDWAEIDDGERWVQEIQHGLKASAAVIVVMSRAARDSEWVEREALFALQLRKPLFIVMAEAIPLPLLLVDRQYTDCFTDYAAGINDLLAALRPALAQPHDSTVMKPLPEHVSPDPNEDNFFRYLAQMDSGDDLALIARELYQWGKQQGATIEFGGKIYPAFHVQVQIADKTVTVYSVLAYLRNPAVQIPFDYLSKYAPYTNYDLRLQTLRQLDRLLPADERFNDTRANRRPTLPLAHLLSDAAHLEQFQTIVGTILGKLRNKTA